MFVEPTEVWARQRRCVYRPVATTEPRRRPGSEDTSAVANSLARNRGYAAAAIIAALSGESLRDGNKTTTPSSAARASNVRRNSLLAATPPVTNKVATP